MFINVQVPMLSVSAPLLTWLSLLPAEPFFSLPCWFTLVSLLLLILEPAFPSSHHWRRTRGTPGTSQVFSARLGLQPHLTHGLKNNQVLRLLVWDSHCYYLNVSWLTCKQICIYIIYISSYCFYVSRELWQSKVLWITLELVVVGYTWVHEVYRQQ